MSMSPRDLIADTIRKTCTSRSGAETTKEDMFLMQKEIADKLLSSLRKLVGGLKRRQNGNCKCDICHNGDVEVYNQAISDVLNLFKPD